MNSSLVKFETIRNTKEVNFFRISFQEINMPEVKKVDRLFDAFVDRGIVFRRLRFDTPLKICWTKWIISHIVVDQTIGFVHRWLILLNCPAHQHLIAINAVDE